MATQPIAAGKVESLCINGKPLQGLIFWLDGPMGGVHSGRFARKLSGHDGEYIRTSSLERGAPVFNWRSWTGISSEEMSEVESALTVKIPQGCLLENITVSGIPNFSKLAPTTRLVFPPREKGRYEKSGKQAILAVWEENSPCRTVGERLEEHHHESGLKTRFIAAAQNKRGVMGIVLASGLVRVGDEVLVYPPVR
jgi:MOSC domain-containing protein YiiM